MINSFESITDQISTDVSRGLSMELLENEINGWNGFVELMREASERHVEDGQAVLDDLQSELLAVSRDKDVMVGHTRLYTVDIYMNGFKAISKDAHGRPTLGIKLPRAPLTFERVCDVECLVGLYRTPVSNQVAFEELGLQVVDIYSHDRAKFADLSQVFVPAKNLVKR